MIFVSTILCHFPAVLLRNLDPLTTEDGVLESLKNVSNMPIRSVRIGRDPLTSASRGICYLELNSVVDSMHLFNDLSTDPPMIDGRQGEIYVLNCCLLTFDKCYFLWLLLFYS